MLPPCRGGKVGCGLSKSFQDRPPWSWPRHRQLLQSTATHRSCYRAFPAPDIPRCVDMMRQLQRVSDIACANPATLTEVAWQQRKCRRLFRYPPWMQLLQESVELLQSTLLELVLLPWSRCGDLLRVIVVRWVWSLPNCCSERDSAMRFKSARGLCQQKQQRVAVSVSVP